MQTLDRLVHGFSRLPGLGRKSAERLVYFLLGAKDEFVESLARDLIALKRNTRPCSRCGVYAEAELCAYCSDPTRETDTICVVEESRDVITIESTQTFRGLYHVLGGAISPVDGIRPADLTIDGLIRRVHEHGVREVILATNPTVEGETTALFLRDRLQANRRQGAELTVTQLALGLPVGGDLEYADRLTLARALNGRTAV
jgi:recombination protein RecR